MKVRFEFNDRGLDWPTFELPDSHPLPTAGLLLELDLQASPSGITPAVVGDFRVVSTYWQMGGTPVVPFTVLVCRLHKEGDAHRKRNIRR